jgi:hypothetical protein
MVLARRRVLIWSSQCRCFPYRIIHHEDLLSSPQSEYDLKKREREREKIGANVFLDSINHSGFVIEKRFAFCRADNEFLYHLDELQA